MVYKSTNVVLFNVVLKLAIIKRRLSLQSFYFALQDEKFYNKIGIYNNVSNILSEILSNDIIKKIKLVENFRIDLPGHINISFENFFIYSKKTYFYN